MKSVLRWQKAEKTFLQVVLTQFSVKNPSCQRTVDVLDQIYLIFKTFAKVVFFVSSEHRFQIMKKNKCHLNGQKWENIQHCWTGLTQVDVILHLKRRNITVLNFTLFETV